MTLRTNFKKLATVETADPENIGIGYRSSLQFGDHVFHSSNVYASRDSARRSSRKIVQAIKLAKVKKIK